MMILKYILLKKRAVVRHLRVGEGASRSEGQFWAWRRLGGLGLGLLVAGLLFVVYLGSMAPTLLTADSAELTVGAVTLGLVHAPGYPVYLLLAHLFTYLPVGDLAYRVNLLSAVATSGTVALLVLLLWQMTGHKVAALVAGLSFGFSFYVWSLSIVAEVYTLQACFLAILLLALWHWRQHGSQHALLVVAGMMGLAAANTPATTLWWPGLLLLAWGTPHRRQLSWRVLLKLAGGFALGLTPLLYLPLRSAAQPEFVYVGHYDAAGAFHALDLTQAGNLLWYLSGGPFGERVFGYSGAELVTESIRFLHRLWGAFLGVGLPLGAWGLWNLRQQRSLAFGLLLTALPHAIFFIGYHTPDKETMFLPVYLIWAVFLGVGLSHLRDIWPAPAARLAPLLLPLGLLLINLPYLDVSQVPNPHQIAATRLQSADPNAIYLARWDEAAAMTYLQLTSDLRPDVTIINTFLSTPQVEQALVQNAQRTQRPVYITDPDSILARQYHLISVEHGFQLQ